MVVTHPPVPPHPKDEAAIDEIKALENRRYRAMIAGDTAVLDLFVDRVRWS